jgi:hypothetical protein
MARPLNEKIAELPLKRREKVEARAAELIAEEISFEEFATAIVDAAEDSSLPSGHVSFVGPTE